MTNVLRDACERKETITRRNQEDCDYHSVQKLLNKFQFENSVSFLSRSYTIWFTYIYKYTHSELIYALARS